MTSTFPDNKDGNPGQSTVSVYEHYFRLVWYTICHHLPSSTRFVCKLGAKSHSFRYDLFHFNGVSPLLDEPKFRKWWLMKYIPGSLSLFYTSKYPHSLMVHPYIPVVTRVKCLARLPEIPRQRARSPVAIPPKGCSASGSA